MQDMREELKNRRLKVRRILQQAVKDQEIRENRTEGGDDTLPRNGNKFSNELLRTSHSETLLPKERVSRHERKSSYPLYTVCFFFIFRIKYILIFNFSEFIL